MCNVFPLIDFPSSSNIFSFLLHAAMFLPPPRILLKLFFIVVLLIVLVDLIFREIPWTQFPMYSKVLLAYFLIFRYLFH